MSAPVCPRCQQPLDFNPTATCPRCGTALMPAAGVVTGPPPATGVAPVRAIPVMAKLAPPAGLPLQLPPRRGLGPLWLGAAAVLLLVLIGGGLALYFRPSGEVPPPPPEKVQEHTGDQLPHPEKAPPDPRIAIVQPTVDKGVAFLKTQLPQLKGMRGGYVGLNGLALLECGVPPTDPAILQIADFIRAGAPGMSQTYDLAASLFFLNRWHESKALDEKDRTMARTLALRIIAGQNNTGIWSYGGVIMSPDQEAKLVTVLNQGGYKPNGPVSNALSMSNTQFAMLAVWGSRHHGVPVAPPLLALAAYFHANQQPDGHWKYPGYGLTATSTCAGLISLAIEKVLRLDKEFAAAVSKLPVSPAKTADANKAFEYVAKTIGRKMGDPGGGRSTGYGGNLFDADAFGDLYFLWTLERAGVIYSMPRIGGKDWYDWGYPIVMKAQLPNGSWSEKHGPLIDTCFALLFLKRSNIAKDLTDKLRELTQQAALGSAPSQPPLPARPGKDV